MLLAANNSLVGTLPACQLVARLRTFGDEDEIERSSASAQDLSYSTAEGVAGMDSE